MAPLPTPPAPPPPPTPGVQPPPPVQPELTAPPPPEFEFIRQEAARPDPYLPINPLAIPRQFLLRAILSEEFDDNVRLAPGGQKQGDVSTVASLSGQYRFETERTFLQTANSITARYSPRFSDRQGISSANINLIGGHQLTPALSLGVSENFARSNDLLQSGFSTSTGVTTPTRSGRSQFIRNAFSPQATYLVTERTSLAVRYANTFVIQEGHELGTGNSTTNTFNGSLSHLFGERTTASLGYTHLIHKSRGNDLSGDDVTASVSHEVGLRTILTLNGSAAFRNPQATPNQNIYGLSLGASRELSPTLRVSGSAGMQDFQGGGRNDAKPTFILSVSKEGVSYRLTGLASLATSENIGQVNDVGLTRNQVCRVTYLYFPSQAWFSTLEGSYQRSDFKQAQRANLLGVQQATIDKYYALLAALNYRLVRSLFLRLSYNLTVRDSTQSLRDTVDNRVAVSIVTDISR